MLGPESSKYKKQGEARERSLKGVKITLILTLILTRLVLTMEYVTAIIQ